jgi:alpha-1,3-rhamnosyl/mannosyltransferase
VLVHAGPAGWNNSSISDQFDKLTATGELIALGYIDEADLATLYSAATCLVYPSIYEGFGLPILEAMASGTPVITSNLSSMPEVGGQAAMLIDPSNQEQLRNALIEVLQDLDLRERLTTAGIQHARLYRWQTCAQATAEIYKRVY